LPELPKSPELPKLGKSEARHAYYRRCQVLRKGGQQCKAPAMKDGDRCYKHQAQADIEHRRQAQYTLPALVDLKTVQRAISDVAQALWQDRIDPDYAGELLERLRAASTAVRLQPPVATKNCSELET
jgi:hypothetical protein